MNDEQFREELIKRLNVLISLIIERTPSDQRTTITEKAKYLLDLGLKPAEVAEILGKKTNYVTSLINRQKKKAVKK